MYFASWDYFTSTYAPHLPHIGTCAGEPYAAVAGDVILSSYLLLFISFYVATYKRTVPERERVKVGNKSIELRLDNAEAELSAVKKTAAKTRRARRSANKTRKGLGETKLQSFS